MKKTLLILIFLFLPFVTHAATEFTSIVDPDNAAGTDYTTLSAWESGNQTDLTAAATQVFSGTKTSSIADDAIVYLCRSGVYQTHYGTLVHSNAAGTQILVEGITGAATEQSGDIWYTANTCDSANYFTISNGGDSAIAVASARASAGTADTTAVTIDGWTTSATNYIKIWTDPSLGNRHNGKWDSNKYRLETGGTSDSLTIQESYTRVSFLQIKASATGHFVRIINVDEGGDCQVSNNIVWGAPTSNYVISGIAAPSNKNLYVWNNLIIIDSTYSHPYNYGIGNDARHTSTIPANVYSYNNTVIGGAYGLKGDPDNSNQIIVCKNCLASNSAVADFSLTVYTGSDFNASQDTTATTYGANSRANRTFSFIDETNDDFHLAPTDTAARGAGTNLSADANLAFSDDIDGQARTGTWDIGADEAPETTIKTPNNLGLVGYWPMDEGSGTKAGDMSGNGNNGDITGATWADGKRGSALSFDRTNDYVNIPHDDSLNIMGANQALSLSLWVKMPTVLANNWPRVFSKADDYNTRPFELFYHGDEDRYVFQLWNGATSHRVYSPTNIDDDQWHHIVVIRDSSAKFYVDGQDVSQSAVNDGWGVNYNSGSVSVVAGALSNSKNYDISFGGRMEEVRLYSRALGSTEITALYNSGAAKINSSQNSQLTSGLVGLWSFNGPDVNMSTNTAYDRAGSNNGTISGATPTIGKVGQALDFDGTDDFVTIPEFSGAEGSAITVSAWFKLDDYAGSTGEDIVSKYRSGFTQWMIMRDTNTGNNDTAELYFTVKNGSGTEVDAGSASDFPQDNDWHQVVGVYDGSNVYIYGDGVSLDSTPPALTGQIYDESHSICVGSAWTGAACGTGGTVFDGKIDEVRVYNRALSAGEVAQLYNMGR